MSARRARPPAKPRRKASGAKSSRSGRVSSTALLELEVFRALFSSVAEEMGVLLQRSSSSPNIKERLDFSCALFTSGGELFAQAAHIPVHLGSAPLSVRAAMAAHEFRPGDAIVLNDPWEGGTHLPDVTLVSAVFCGGEQPAFYVATRAHHADVGGASPGSMSSCVDVYGEGLRIPPVPLLLGGEFEASVMRILLANVRTPDERRADLMAQVAANRRGIERFDELATQYGVRELHDAADELLDHGERRQRALLKSIPDGCYESEDVLDGDGFVDADVRLCLRLEIRGERARLDFRETDDQLRGSMNANPAIVLSAVLYCFQCLMTDSTPPNEGMARVLDIVLREGSLLHPRVGAAVAGGNVETSQRVVDLVFGALSRAVPGRIPAASQGTMNNLTVGTATGEQPFSYYETTGGGAGAGPDQDGASGIQVHMTNTRNTPIEALEIAYPIRVVRTRLAARTGGAGRYRGGDGIEREIELTAPARVSMLSDRRRHAPWGVDGGAPGRPGRNWVVCNGRKRQRPGTFSEDLEVGDRVGFRTPGGGGFGEARPSGGDAGGR